MRHLHKVVVDWVEAYRRENTPVAGCDHARCHAAQCFRRTRGLRPNLVSADRNRTLECRRPRAPCPRCSEFYDAFFPRLEEAIDYCDKFSLDNLPDDALNLLHMIYSLIMVAMAVEIMHQPAPVDAADAVMIRTGEPVP